MPAFDGPLLTATAADLRRATELAQVPAPRNAADWAALQALLAGGADDTPPAPPPAPPRAATDFQPDAPSPPPPPGAPDPQQGNAPDLQPERGSAHFDSSFAAVTLDPSRGDPVAQFLARPFGSDPGFGPPLIFERGDAPEPFYAPAAIFDLGPPPGPPPVVGIAAANGVEDNSIALSIAVAVSQGGDALAVTLLGVPAGATLSAGTNLGGGVWSISVADLDGLTITPGANNAAPFTLIVHAIETTPIGLIGVTEASLPVTIVAVADTPSLATSAASGNEDSAIALPIIASLADLDGSESLTVTLSGVPTGAALNHGTNLGGGVWTVSGAQLAGLAITPAANSDADFTLTVGATATDTGGDTAASAPSMLAVTVNAVADAPQITVSAASGNEDSTIALAIAVALADGDGSETLGATIAIGGVPSGATLSAGSDQGGGVWHLTQAQLAGLAITPPADSDADFTLTVSATATETSTGLSATGTAQLGVTVAGVADTPSLSVAPASGNEDSPIALSISAALADSSETLAITIANVPSGATLSAGTNLGAGIWRLTQAQLAGLTITPPADSDSDFTLSVTATATDGSSTANQSTLLAVTVTAVADAPTLSAAPASGNEDSAIALSITAALTDTSETLAIAISGVPAGATLSAGTDQGGGVWALTSAQLAGLTVTPPADSDADFALTVTATSTDTGGLTAATSANLAVTVAPVADAPSLSVAAASGNEDSAIALSIASALTDPSETLGIAIAGVPTGATLSAGTDQGGGVWALTAAQLAGLTITPAANRDTDFTLTVTATATDGASTASTSASLAVTVTAVADAPSLSANPASGNEDSAIALTISTALTDTDGSEALGITIAGVPTGASLNQGTNQGSGVWALTAAQLAGLTITPPTNSDADFTLTVTATSTDTGGVQASTGSTLAVTVAAVADAPTLSVSPASGNEDFAIALSIGAALTDGDGSESLAITIGGVPAGATLSAGTDQGGGVWSLTAAQLAGLTITPPANSDADFTLSVTATASDGAAQASVSANLAVSVAAVADTPSLSVSTASGNEDSAIALSIGAGLNDPSESLAIAISFVPAGATLSAGTDQGGGVWALTPAQLAGLTITPPANSDGDFTLSVTATATDGGSTASQGAALAVTVAAVADAPSLAVTPASGNEDSAIALSIAAALADTDGSETLAITIGGVPAGATLSAGTDQGGGAWTLTPAQLAGLTITPAASSDADFTLTVAATATDTGGVLTTTSANLAVTVAAVADAPSLSVAAASGSEDSAIALSITAGLTDPSEALSIAIAGVPAGAALSAGTDQGGGTWALTAAQLAGLTITPPADSDGDFTLSVTATLTDGAGTASTSGNIAVTVAAVADAPALSAQDASGDEDTAIALTISSALVDGDGSESLSIVVSGVPAGAVLSAGTDLGGGSWALTAAQLAGLTITPPLNDFSDFTLTVAATATEAVGGATAATSTTIDVTVVGAADAPSLGVAAASGNEDGTVALSITAALADPTETLSIAISNVPVGVTLSAGTNQGGGVWALTAAQLAGLTLTPVANSDADFTLTVTATSTDTSSGDSATTQGTINVAVAAVADTPSLSVTGTASGNEDSAIALTISGALADGDGSESLGFRVSGVPAGATLSAGADQGGGVWIVGAAQAAGLTVTPPANSDADFILTVQAVATEAAGGSASSAGQTIAVTVDPVADAPSLTVQTTAGLHDTAIALSIASALVDGDGSETLALTISGVPAGAALNYGTDLGSGVWALTAAQLAGLTITPPAGDDADISLTVTATLTEAGGGVATTIQALTVIVAADPLTLATQAASGNEDSAIALDIATVVADLTDTVTLSIAGMPAGASLSAGTNQGGGVWALTAAQLAGLTITPPSNSDADFTLTVTATAAHQAGGSDVQSQNLAVTIAPVADAPSFGFADVTGDPDTPIALAITAGLGDSDGSETLSLRFTGVPAGASLTLGSDQGGGVWLIADAMAVDLTTLAVNPPPGSIIDFSLTVEAIVHDGASTATETGSFDVSINGGADRPNLTVQDATGNEDSPIALDILASLVDPGETLSITISGMQAGAQLNHGTLQGNGDWLLSPVDLSGLTITPPPDSDNDLALLIEATSTNAGLGDATSAKETLNVTVNAVADAPDLSVNDAAGNANSAIALDIGSLLNDTDGSESLALLIDGVPTGATLNHGVDQGGGSWALAPVDLAGLTVTSAPNDTSDFTLTVHATATDTGGVTATATASLIVTVQD